MMIKRKKNYDEYTDFYIKNIIHNKVLNRQKQLADSLKIKQLYLKYEHQNFVKSSLNDTNTKKKKQKKKIKILKRPVSAVTSNLQSTKNTNLNSQAKQNEKIFSNTENRFFITTQSSTSKLQTTHTAQTPLYTRESTIEDQVQNQIQFQDDQISLNLLEQKLIKSNQKKLFYPNQNRCKSAENGYRRRNRVLTTNNSRENTLDKQLTLNENDIAQFDKNINVDEKNHTVTSKQYRNRKNQTSFNFFYNKNTTSQITQQNSNQISKQNLSSSLSIDPYLRNQCYTQMSTPSNVRYHDQQNTPKNTNQVQLNRLVKIRNICMYGSEQKQNNFYNDKQNTDVDKSEIIYDQSYIKYRKRQQQLNYSYRSNSTQHTSRNSNKCRSVQESYVLPSPLHETVRFEEENDEQNQNTKSIDQNPQAIKGDDAQILGVKPTFYNEDLLQVVEENRKNFNVNNQMIDIKENLLLERQRRLQDRQCIHNKYRFILKQSNQSQSQIKMKQIEQITNDKTIQKRIPMNAAKFYLKKEEKNRFYNLFNQNENAKNEIQKTNSNQTSLKINSLKQQNKQYEHLINNFVKTNKSSTQDEIDLIKNCIIQYNVDTRIPLPSYMNKYG